MSLFRTTKQSTHLLPAVRRLHTRHISSAANGGSDAQFNQSWIPKWVSGLAAASTLTGLFYYKDNHNDPASSSSVFDQFKVKGKSWLALADTEEADTSLQTPDHPLSISYQKPRFLFKDTFRRKVFFKYEKRIRTRSPPEKVFEYFASVRNSDGEILMTPADLMRAVVPVFPPTESDLVREGFLPGERSPGELRCPPSEFFMLFDVNSDGLISFKEYIFFVTLLSIPESSFSVAFKMFDIDSNGKIDRDEFKQVMALMRAQHRQGATHCDGLRAGNKVGGAVDNGGLVEYFFGEDGAAQLHHDKFVEFLRHLHDELVRLEFSHYDYRSKGSISAKDFALSMVASADIKHVNKLLDRVDELDNDPELSQLRISENEFRKFAELRAKLEPFALALFSFGKVNGLLTRRDFQRAASQVCGVSVTDNMVDVIFYLFDTNCDGNLSADEFLRVLHRREREVAQPVESGISGFFSCCWDCKRRCSLSRLLS